jgi:hypothetical protein
MVTSDGDQLRVVDLLSAESLPRKNSTHTGGIANGNNRRAIEEEV